MCDCNIDDMEFIEVVKAVESFNAEGKDMAPIRIAFLPNFTINHVITYCKFLCYQEGLNPEIYMGDYDNILQEVMDPDGSLYRFSPDIIMICLKMENLSESLIMEFSSLSTTAVKEEADRVANYITSVLNEIRKNTNAMILLNNFEIPVFPSLGICDYQDRNGQVNILRKLNDNLLDIIKNYSGSYIVDMDLLKSTIGYLHFNDNRYWHIGKAPLTVEASKLIAKEYMKFIRALKGTGKKCLVLDCDNTLWGGIIGEDGMHKIEIGNTYPGSAYREFQQAILNLYNRGVMLSICSKNNERDVLDVIESHPDMVLRREHFVSIKVNWNDKVKNLMEIATELNIGLDSLVFIDDSDFEIECIRKMLPEIKAVKLPRDPSQFRDLLNSCGLFDTLTVSKEDRKRNSFYREDMQRKDAKTSFCTLDDYYEYLEMEAVIRRADSFSIPRIAQLTERTNQFNLTAKRYSEADIKELGESNSSQVFFLNLKDRFGDSGIVGAAILKHFGTEVLIDNFLLSCRVIGRGIEDLLLKACIVYMIERGCEQIVGVYTPTTKNAQVKDFYRNHSFVYLGEDNGSFRYLLPANGACTGMPGYFKKVTIECNE